MRERWAHARISEAAAGYFDSCARIRGISRSALLRRMLNLIAMDQPAGSILDDEAARDHRKGEHGFREQRPAKCSEAGPGS